MLCPADMNITPPQSEPQLQQRLHREYLRQASEWLGTPAVAISFWEHVQFPLFENQRPVGCRGLDGDDPVFTITGYPRGRLLQFGMERYHLTTPLGPLDLVQIQAPVPPGCDSDLFQFWAVPKSQQLTLYRMLRRIGGETLVAEIPILPAALQSQLWSDTIGFLTEHRALLARYEIAINRGVLLLGEPGNGKTTACRWLRAECLKHKLEWRNVTLAQFRQARCNGTLPHLFALSQPGCILFDDFDEALRLRSDHSSHEELTTFLTAMDGIDHRSSSVFLFTSNARECDFDPAFLRPGRIDQVLHFRKPDEECRRRFFEQRWPAELLEQLSLPEVIEQTEGLSFATLGELKKRLVMQFAQTKRWDWQAVWSAFQLTHAVPRRDQTLGFQAATRPVRTPPTVSACGPVSEQS